VHELEVDIDNASSAEDRFTRLSRIKNTNKRLAIQVTHRHPVSISKKYDLQPKEQL